MATEQKVGATTFTMPSDTELVATRRFDAPRDLVWEALTSPEHLPHWMLGEQGWTMSVREADLRPGGRWHFVWHGPDGGEMEMRGEFREVVPPERFVNTERWGEDWPEVQNTIALTEEGDHTNVVTTVHYPSAEARERAISTGMLKGWAYSYDLLDSYLRTLVEASRRAA